MSMRLEQDAVYLLPNAWGEHYAILRASQTAEGWQLTECRELPGLPATIDQRAALPAGQLLRYRVDQQGRLIEQRDARRERTTQFTIADLNLLGWLRGGAFVPPGAER
ncbi:hypothetical protein [Kallotenue papyrolyticum]|uniref:hypothetical protein n=1 Tax=Kallotenue papyrolyticum TaxID=1325125 RepID=UPI0004785B0B|nr:hypothetical protein [Kallotenue papyrolyticum]